MAFLDIESTDTLPQGRTKLNGNKDATIAALNAKSPAGGVWFDGAVSSYAVWDAFSLGGNVLSFSFWVSTSDSNTSLNLYRATGSDGGYGVYLRNGLPAFLAYQAGTTSIHRLTIASGASIADGNRHHVLFVLDGTDTASVSVQFYVDGVAVSGSDSISPSGVYGDSGSSEVTVFAFSEQEGRDTSVINRALTATEVQTLYNHGGALPAGPEWRWGDVTALTSGTLETGARYRINTFNTGDDFTNVGAASNATGEEFTATGTTPTTWTNSSELEKIGALAHLPMDETAGSVCYDASPNGYDATLSATGWERIKPKSQENERTILGLGTAAPLDVPAAGDAAAGEVVKGDDTRLTDARTPTTHTHDDRYYTETEIDGMLPTGSVVGTTDTQTLTNKTVDLASNTVQGFPVELKIIVSQAGTDLATGTGKVTYRTSYAFTLTDVRASVSTAPVGSTIEVDINEGGVSVLSTILSIDAGEKTSETAATAAVISDSAIAADAEISIDVDQVGSTTAGQELVVTLIGTRTL